MSEQFKTVPELDEALSVQGTDLAYTVVAPGSGGQDRKVTWATVGAYLQAFVVKGDTGDKGDAATIAVGATSTVAPGSPATVTNSGTSSDAVLDFSIPEGIQGDKGDKGDKGDQGDPGFGIPAGGTTGQVIAKASSTDFDVEYKTLAAADVGAYADTNPSSFVDASGAAAAAPVQSVNTQTGAVVLGASDVGAVPTSRTISVSGTGLSGGGDLTADRTITLDPSALAADSAFSSVYASSGDVLALVIALGG